MIVAILEEGLLEDGLAEAGGALEVGGDDGFELVDDAQAAFHFGDDALLFGKQGDGKLQTLELGLV